MSGTLFFIKIINTPLDRVNTGNINTYIYCIYIYVYLYTHAKVTSIKVNKERGVMQRCYQKCQRCFLLETQHK